MYPEVSLLHGPRDCICNHTLIFFYPSQPLPAAATADARPGTASKLSIATPWALLSCASIGATPGNFVVQSRSTRGSGGIPGVSSGGTHTSSHTASYPPAVRNVSQRAIKKREIRVPPGTPPPTTPAIEVLASRSWDCFSGSISTPDSFPMSRILPRICYECARPFSE